MYKSPQSLYQLCLEAVVDISSQYIENVQSPARADSPGFMSECKFQPPAKRNSVQSKTNHHRNKFQLDPDEQTASNLKFFTYFQNFFHKKKNSTTRSEDSLDDSEELLSLANNSSIDSYYHVNSIVCEDLLKTFEKRYQINDNVLCLPLFNGKNRIQFLDIEDARLVTERGLQMLQNHHLITLNVGHLTSCSVNQLINNLSGYSMANLQSLSVPYCSFSSSNKVCTILRLTNLANLSSLDLSFTDFTDHGLEIIADDLHNLHSLNISHTRVTHLKPLLRGKDRLVSLKLFNLSATCRDEKILTQFTNLQHLDISDERNIEDNKLQTFLGYFADFPYLTELDLSGRSFSTSQLLTVLKHKHSHSPLKFIGLFNTSFVYNDVKEIVDEFALTIAGSDHLDHIVNCLERYMHRHTFSQSALFNLYGYCMQHDDIDDNSFNPNLSPHHAKLVMLMVEMMDRYSRSFRHLLAATACLHLLTKNAASHHLHPDTLIPMVNACLRALEQHPNNQQLSKNILLTICTDRILQDISFDRFRCVRLIMNQLIIFSDVSLNRLGLIVCSILAGKISTHESSLIGTQPNYMTRLLYFVENYYNDQSQVNENILKLALSTLWNFTDESPATCETFIKNNGLKLYIKTLMTFTGHYSIETKILGLINNIAEVPSLRACLLNTELLKILKNLISNDKIDISYFAAGIMSHLGSDNNLNWCKVQDFDIHQCLLEMEIVIGSWCTPQTEMVAYRSFAPFVALLQCKRSPAIRLWALWAIHHVCTKNPQKYCPMIKEDKCYQAIVEIFEDRLEQQYMLSNRTDRLAMMHRLMDLSTIAQQSPIEEKDDNDGPTNHFLYSITTKYDCFRWFNWNSSQCDSNEISPYQPCANKGSKKRFFFSYDDLTKTKACCDCSLKYCLSHDSFIFLPSIILKAIAYS